MKLNLSLRTKIIGMVLGILSVVGFGAWWNESYLSKHYEESIAQSFSAVTHAGVNRITDQFYQLYNNVQAFSMNGKILSGNAEQISHELDRYVDLYGLYDLILIVDKHGRYIGSNTKDIKGKKADISELTSKNYTKEPWFQAAMNGEFTESKEKGIKGTFVEPWISDPLAKIAFKEERLGSSFSTSIKDDKGNVLAVITSRANNRWISEVFQGLVQSLSEINSDGSFFLVDNHGVLLYSQDSKGQPIHTNDFFRKNMAVSNPVIKKALQGKDGVEAAWSEMLKAESILAYTSLEDSKWIDSIGWHLIIEDHYEDLQAPAIQSERNFYVIFGSTLFIALAVSIWFAVVLAKQVAIVTMDLANNSRDVSQESTSLAASATELSESSTEQAAALQETVAAVDEIFAMVEKNADAANRSKEYSHQSREAARQGKEIVENMLNAISEIDSANKQVSERMDVSNKELSAITNLIKEIGSKTKVINDIVFQTKLLSFNASVEAARAGEYGKGFAVVAEEVGNLAQMSGNAAKEISGLLDESVKKVETIVSESKSQVEKLMLMNKQKVDAGSQTAHECASALEDILQNVSNVDSMVTEIAVASKEQSIGIKEISKAVGQMEQVIQQNTAVAQMSSSSSEKLRSQAEGLQSIVRDLQVIVTGEASGIAFSVASEKKTSLTTADNVVLFKTKKKVSETPKVSSKGDASFTFNGKKEFKTEKSEASLSSPSTKIAAGGDFVPSANDPGFDE